MELRKPLQGLMAPRDAMAEARARGMSSDSCSLERRPGATSAGAGSARAVRLATELETTGIVPCSPFAMPSRGAISRRK